MWEEENYGLEENKLWEGILSLDHFYTCTHNTFYLARYIHTYIFKKERERERNRMKEIEREKERKRSPKSKEDLTW